MTKENAAKALAARMKDPEKMREQNRKAGLKSVETNPHNFRTSGRAKEMSKKALDKRWAKTRAEKKRKLEGKDEPN